MKMVFCGVDESLLDGEISFAMGDGAKKFFLECQSDKYEKAGIEEGKYYDVIKYDTPNGLFDCYIELKDNKVLDVNSCFFAEELEDEIQLTKAISLNDLLAIQSSGHFIEVMNEFIDMYNGYRFDSYEEAYKTMVESLTELTDSVKEMRDELIDSLNVESLNIPLNMMIELEED